MRLWRRREWVKRSEPAAAVATANGAPVREPAPPHSSPAPRRDWPALFVSVRRFLVVQALMLWQGGFLFYTTFVVPTGTEVLGSAAAQGAITARVTDALNALAVAGLALVALDLALTRDPAARRTAARWWCWSLAFVCQYVLFVSHRLLDAFMDPTRTVVVIHPPFYPVHRVYLWASTVQWAVGVLLVWWTLRAWAAEDRQPRPAG